MEANRRILRLPDVEDRIGLRRSAIYAMISRGLFPKPIPLTGRAVGFIEHEIQAWVDARIAQREAA